MFATVLGALSSVVLMLLLAHRWKLPHRLVVVAAVAIGIAVALPFFWIHAGLQTAWGAEVGVVLQIVATLAVGMTLILLRFWRDPERTPPAGKGLVLSPADGKIGFVTNLDAGSTPLVRKGGRDYHLHELTGTRAVEGAVHLIGVEMTFLDVHVNRCPISGRVEWLKHIEGGFISLGRDEAPFLNARLTSLIENPSLMVGVVQVASRLVRRVESYLTVGQTVSAGQRLGMIRFGSLVTVVVPQREDVQIEVEPGDRVTAGVTILGRYTEDAWGGDE